MSIRLITFDLDDTLWDNRPVILGAEAAMRDWLALHTPRLAAQPVKCPPTYSGGKSFGTED